jgi:hypothetical protein
VDIRGRRGHYALVSLRRVLLVALVLTTSCSSDHAAVETAATPSSNETTTLTCADNGHPTTPPGEGDVNANGLTFSGVEPVHERPSSPMPVSNGSTHMFFEKVFLYVATSASPTTRMTVISPTDALLYYAPPETWQSVIPDADMIRDATKSVTVSRCDSDLTGYFGGILLSTGACVEIRVEGDGSGDEARVTLPLPGPC